MKEFLVGALWFIPPIAAAYAAWKHDPGYHHDNHNKE